MKANDVFKLVKDTFTEWNEDKVPLWAAALAYYTVFSLAPLLLIAIAIAGSIFGDDAARGQIVGQIQGLVGREGAEVIQGMIQNTQKPGSGGLVATIIGVVTLIFGATGVFGQLQDALNTIWEVKPKPGLGVRSFVQSRFLSFAMVLVLGFLLLVSLVLSAVLAGIGNFFGNFVPGYVLVGQVLNFVLSFGVVTLLFASIYKFLPDVDIPWKDLWVGSAVTALLFNFGKFLIGLYLGSSSVGSTYGAAGSLVVILIWVFYSAQIILFGAEFTQVYAKYRGSDLPPSKHAVRINKGNPDRDEMPARLENDRPVATRRAHKPGYGRYAAIMLGSIATLASSLRRQPSRRRRR
ncbi:YihY/virulence factor BrkB family protein [Leptolyngbya sp. FACHB-36]|uniref:YihY/virulence factor BrkB family protein n=1 Tax=Leptolyngbya sp. FACHB-36 TaxID=2692808 RepID=UPI001680553F|nr:YihY/virulence factor BrkB family protein [Leptolyngbya sp. FACHB-36]MBD2022271.1 YihY/virulence factor BrkB family protein [Leptolyngbya sp. FACHB-36]